MFVAEARVESGDNALFCIALALALAFGCLVGLANSLALLLIHLLASATHTFAAFLGCQHLFWRSLSCAAHSHRHGLLHFDGGCVHRRDFSLQGGWFRCVVEVRQGVEFVAERCEHIVQLLVLLAQRCLRLRGVAHDLLFVRLCVFLAKTHLALLHRELCLGSVVCVLLHWKLTLHVVVITVQNTLFDAILKRPSYFLSNCRSRPREVVHLNLGTLLQECVLGP
mmetsp:Transcript_3235/g.7255  ORF Transcript_3235/g.7255 Transcript_3235/m.7255 type:complete len:224 (+) Transcript_3235:294-965(+)